MRSRSFSFLCTSAGVFHIIDLAIRFPFVIVLLVIAGTDIRTRMSGRTALLGLAVALFVVNVAVVAASWRGYQVELQEFRSAFSQIERGGKFISMRPDAARSEIFRFEPSRHVYLNGLFNLFQLEVLVVTERGVYSPYLFTHPQKQILRIRSAYRAIDFVDSGSPTPWSWAMAVLRDPYGNHPFLNDPIWAPTRNWWRRYDYLTVLYPGLVENLSELDEQQFQPVFRGRWINVYRISQL